MHLDENRRLVQALKLYRLDNQRYPSTEQGLGALVAGELVGFLRSVCAPPLSRGRLLQRLP